MDERINELIKAIVVITKNGCECMDQLDCDECPLNTDETEKEVNLCTAIQAYNK